METKNNETTMAHELAWAIEQAIIDSEEKCLSCITIKQLLAIRQIVTTEIINFKMNTKQ